MREHECNCFYDTFTAVNPSLLIENMAANLPIYKTATCARSVQLPNAAEGNALTVELDSNPADASDGYLVALADIRSS